MGQKADFFREYDLNFCRNRMSNKPEAIHQSETINHLTNWFNSKNFPSGSIVALPTGSGKTFTAVRFICKNVLGNDYKLLWLAHTHHLLEQAYYSFGPLSEEINEGYEVGWIPEPRERLNVRVVSGTQNHFNINQIKTDDDVLIATLQSIANANKKNHPKFKEFLKSANGKLFVVFDEAHHSPAPTYRNLILSLRKQFPELYLLGLTATPTYMDINKRGWLKKLFPQEIIHQTSVENLIAQRILAKPVIKESDTDFAPEFNERMYTRWVNSNKDLPESVISQLAKNAARNRKITQYYIDNKDDYKKTIIFADRYTQCDVISNFLNDEGISADVMYSQQGNERNAEVLDQFKNNKLDVLVNIKMLTEGTDVPDVNTVFITRQTTSVISMTQMVGRALRGPKFGGNAEANLVFFQDNWQKAINWVKWDPKTWGPITPEQEYEKSDGKFRKPIPPFDFIIPNLYDIMDRREFNPFLTLMPIGWYKVLIALPDEDGNPEEVEQLVMVFENEKDSFEELINSLKNENLEEFDDENVKLIENKARLKKWFEKFFPPSNKHVGRDILKSICDISKHMAQNMNEPPRFIEFKEGKWHDLDLIAQKYIEKDMGIENADQKLFEEYNRDDRYWKVFYYDYGLFKSQYNMSVEWILSQHRWINEIVANKEKRIIKKLKKGSVAERIEACDILGDMGIEELIHEKTINLLKITAKNDVDLEVRNSAQRAIDLINNLVLSQEDKQYIKERDKFKCLCCGEDQKNYLQVDHIKPRYYEVDNSEDNLQTLCKICNITKSTENIDFRKKETSLLKSLTVFPGMEKIDTLENWNVRDIKWWNKFLKRNINFFYRCGAVKSINIAETEQNWRIELNEGNNVSWLMSFIDDLTLNIQSIRKEYGYSGPKELSIIKPKEPVKNEPRIDIECSELIKILKKGDDRQKAHAATRLGNLNCTNASAPLIKALEDHERSVRTRAAASLGKIGDQKAINPLIQMFRIDHDGVARRSIVKIGNRIGKPVIEELVFYLKRLDVYIRIISIEALGELKDPDAVEGLLNSLNDKESTVRWKAVRALGAIGNDSAIRFLENLKNDPDEKVRKECIKVLKEFRSPIEILFETFDKELKKIDSKITSKTIKDGFSYYSPERVFIYAISYSSQKIRLDMYTGKGEIKGVEKRSKIVKKWGVFELENEKQIPEIIEAVKISYKRMKTAIRNNETTTG
ncbi:MAG: HEAT repeat domain-containing protein [Methanobacteriaceae archaeon]|nr:HEAT repeat domain-containing protein [Methanobacteriaceae archaeon]